MKRLALVFACQGLFFTLISINCITQSSQQFYAGATAGFVNPKDFHEYWYNIHKPHTTDLSYEMKNSNSDLKSS
jgi:hypothetical protein